MGKFLFIGALVKSSLPPFRAFHSKIITIEGEEKAFGGMPCECLEIQ
jgi:hypothetical protein